MGESDMSETPRINRYDCQKCGRHIITIDRDYGVTPFMLLCLATEGCKGCMYSRFYRDPRGVPMFEWYSPDIAERAVLDAGTMAHVEQGGLLIRPIAGRATAGQSLLREAIHVVLDNAANGKP